MPPSAERPRPVFVLGAYPSALHVRWAAPDGSGEIRAIPIDNEPVPFWSGVDQEERIENWKSQAGFRPEWGSVAPVGHLNGSSGAWVDRNVIDRLGATRAGAWITDCLDTYRMSTGVERALAERFAPWAAGAGAPLPNLLSHPSEGQIVDEALASHSERLRTELHTARPKTIVTLGNAALRVLKDLLGAGEAPSKLVADHMYGQRISVRIDGRATTWYPLAHPASPAPYQEAHERWLRA